MLKFHPRTGHESPEGERKYCSTVSLTSALVGVVGECQAPAALPPGKVTGSQVPNRRWVGPRTGLDGCGKSCSSVGC